MCGRYVLFSTPEQLVEGVKLRTGAPSVTLVGDADTGWGIRPSYNIAPTHTVPIVRYFNGAPTIGPAIWGYPPKTVFNARGETVFDKPTFAGSVPCVFVMNGWYEWTADPNPAPGDRRKQPWLTFDTGNARVGDSHQTPSSDPEQLIFLAGLCKAIEGKVYATMVTTAATPDLEWLHHRMPRVLVRGAAQSAAAGTAESAGEAAGENDEVEAWLSGDFQLAEQIAAVPPSHGLEGLASEKVDKAVGNVANNDARLVFPNVG